MSVKSEATNRLARFLKEIPALKEVGTNSSEFVRWKRSVEIAIENTFGGSSRHLRGFTEIRFYPNTVVELIVTKQMYQEGLFKAQIHLESILKEIEYDWSDAGPVLAQSGMDDAQEQALSNQVFVVHGRDDGTKNEVARFLEHLGLEVVILHERPNEGRTIILKFEDHSGVGFAVVLCTPDDVGALAAEQQELRPRPRQNVILELGFFWGKLGRKKVCALLDGDMDMPSDFGGVLYIPLDESEGWKLTLARELRAAGMNIDLNRIV